MMMVMMTMMTVIDDDGDYDDDDGDDDDDYDDGHRNTPLSTKPSFLSHSKEKDGNSQNWKTKFVCAGSF